jgi:hypothetical protein
MDRRGGDPGSTTPEEGAIMILAFGAGLFGLIFIGLVLRAARQ